MAPAMKSTQGGTQHVADREQPGRIRRVSARAATRLVDLMKSGNRYVAGVTSVNEHGIRVLIREVYQAPELQGRVSFRPSVAAAPELRAYTKDRALRLDIDEDVIITDEDDEDLPIARASPMSPRPISSTTKRAPARTRSERVVRVRSCSNRRYGDEWRLAPEQHP
jgi:hypothetical protein